MLDNIFSRFELFPYSFSRLAKKKKKDLTMILAMI